MADKTSVKEASINTVVMIDDKEYVLEVDIPTSAPSASEPYTFTVAQKEDAENPLLFVAFGGKENVDLQLSPPKSIFPATGSTRITELHVEVVNWENKDLPSKHIRPATAPGQSKPPK